MGVPYLRPRVGDLLFRVYARPLHPEFFDILAVRRVQREDYELTIHITRTGHVIDWKSGDLFLTEVAGGHGSLPQSSRLLEHRLRGERNGTVGLRRGLEYQTSFQVEVLAPEVYGHVHDEILADGHKRGLLHNFRPHHRLAFAPLALVSVEARPDCLFLSAFHTFPDELTVVKTQSLIERR